MEMVALINNIELSTKTYLDIVTNLQTIVWADPKIGVV